MRDGIWSYADDLSGAQAGSVHLDRGTQERYVRLPPSGRHASQVTVEYDEDNQPVRVDIASASFHQHSPEVSLAQIREDMIGRW